jgi:chemotaxis protein CheY-P-specific phosphatase CheC
MNFESMTVPQLDVYAREKDIDIAEAKNKAQKVAIIKAAEDETISVTVDGIEVAVHTAVLESYEFLEGLSRLEDEDPLAIPKLLKMLFGDEYKAVIKKLQVNGSLPVYKAVEFFAKLMEEVGAKNS